MEWTDSLTGLGWALSSSKAKWEGFLGLGRYKTRLERFDLEVLRGSNEPSNTCPWDWPLS